MIKREYLILTKEDNIVFSKVRTPNYQTRQENIAEIESILQTIYQHHRILLKYKFVGLVEE